MSGDVRKPPKAYNLAVLIVNKTRMVVILPVYSRMPVYIGKNLQNDLSADIGDYIDSSAASLVNKPSGSLFLFLKHEIIVISG
ncbi:hypothetical protein ES703_56086 [subsurface metagenome]